MGNEKITWRQFENEPKVNMRELDGPKRDIWMLMALKEASQGHASREPLTSRGCCVLSWSRARFHGDWQCVSSGTSSALNSCAWGFSRAFYNLLIFLFKPSLVHKSNNFHFGFNPLFKIWHRPQITVLVSDTHSSSFVEKFFAITCCWTLELFLTYKYLIPLGVVKCPAK